jgi:phosphate transport system protein
MAKIERYFDQEFGTLRGNILAMGALVEKAIEFAVLGLIDRNPEAFNQVMAVEEKINQFHISIDESCMHVLARQAPMASDLRLVLGCIKINSDLERMGDQAVNITHCGRHYISLPPLKPLTNLPRMAEDVRMMTREALDAFFRQDQDLAKAVVLKDDAVDAFKRTIFAELTAIMKSNPDAIERAMDLILISRNLERIGDHATNISEDVIFVASGVDIRHGTQKSVG